MKSKLTITVDAELIPAAKQFARSHGVSLSSLVEKALREATEKPEPPFPERRRGKFEAVEGPRVEPLKPEPPFSERWRRRLAQAPRIEPPKPGEDPRYDYLARKYLS